MKDNKLKNLPLGTSDFAVLRYANEIYVDKSDLVYELASTRRKYFLARPRRFGKSLLISTFESLFTHGLRDFKGLAIEKLWVEETKFLVVRLDFSEIKFFSSPEEFSRKFASLISRCFGTVGFQYVDDDLNSAAGQLSTWLQTLRLSSLVVLIDEYDAPLLDVMHEDKNLPILRNVMRNFYSPLKACDPYLRYVFLTGITKFSQLSIFSELNNIKNISMDEPYVAICGITEEEIKEQMSYDLDLLAEKMQITRDEVLAKLKENYDGYHFTWPSPDIYNPFSLFNAFNDGKFNSYWFGSGTPTYLIEMLNKFGVLPSEIGGIEAVAAEFDAPTERMTSITPLLYQSGYITIKGYDSVFDIYTLDIPNKEVRIGLMRNLIPSYITNDT